MGDQRRIGVISDISCVGRCSATAALPIYAVAGIHGNVIPTALFSTQTGGYTGYTYRDLSEDMMGIVRHFKELDLKFDLLYTGYLTGEEHGSGGYFRCKKVNCRPGYGQRRQFLQRLFK